MKTRLSALKVGVVIALLVAVGFAGTFWLAQRSTAQTRIYTAPRAADGKPNLNGIWQAMNAASWDLEGHAARPSPIVAMGAKGAIPGGLSVVEGGTIPYRPEALVKKKDNLENWLLRDPTVKCYMPGVPRATYMPFPFQIVQTSGDVLITYEFAGAARIVYMNSSEASPADTWMGWSRGHWEGETLVVDVTSFNDQTWFDSAGNYHSDKLHVVERYTATDPNHLSYEATIEDPDTFMRPWKIQMPLYRRMEADAQLLDFKCVEFVEELMYGHLRRRATN